MIRSEGMVVEVDSERKELWVEIPERSAACGNCSSSGACQTGVYGEGGARRYKMANQIDAKVGDRVSFGVADGILLRASWFSYILPAVLAICIGAVGQGMGGDPGAIAGTLVGLAIGFFWLRRTERRAKESGEILSLERPQAMCHVRELV